MSARTWMVGCVLWGFSVVGCSDPGGGNQQALGGEDGGLGAGGAVGAGGGTSEEGFVSDDPRLPRTTIYPAAGGSIGQPGGPPAPDPGEPARIIEEADVVQAAGDRLYTLARFGGLSVLDVGDPDVLRILGRFRTDATPFEMYLRGETVVALFTSWGYSAGGAWIASSRVVALDTSNPGSITVRGQFEIPGDIQDSRSVGDVLYVVARENGSCHLCATGVPRTLILSLDLSNPAAIRKVDQLEFDDSNDAWGWGRHSVAVNQNRMFVAGRLHDADRYWSTIQVVDVSDPGGDLRLGTSVEVEGELASRWQMDEHDGVLRVVGQAPQWSLGVPPVVQTFRIESSDSLVPLGRLAIRLPRPESLRSARFDGPRGYVVTAEQTDPLFTIDLSNPALPLQVGELEMPGFIHHMEPRGDRLIGLGVDPASAEGVLTLSVFDVTDLAAPRLLDRVHFGEQGAAFPEDQDRIHKALRIDGDLVLVPYGAQGTDAEGCTSIRKGVQLVDLTSDDLVRRGFAPTQGEARRAFLLDGRLFTVSEMAVQAFDVTNRDAPVERSSAAIAHHVEQVVPVGDSLVRLGSEIGTDRASVDVTVPAEVTTPAPALTPLDLTGGSCAYFVGLREGFESGGNLFLLSDLYALEQGSQVTVTPVDLTAPAAPQLLPALHVWAPPQTGVGFSNAGGMMALAGGAFLSRHVSGMHPDSPSQPEYVGIDVIDLRDPAALTAKVVDLPRGLGVTGFHTSGARALVGRYEPLAAGTNRVRFFVDSLDVSDPALPRVESSVNVPGSLVAWDGGSQRAVTVDYRRVVLPGTTYESCFNQGFVPRPGFEPDGGETYHYRGIRGTCTGLEHTLRLVRFDGGQVVLEGSRDLQRGHVPNVTAIGDGVAFVAVANGLSPVILVARGLATGDLEVNPVTLEGAGFVRSVVARGQVAVALPNDGPVSIIDASGGTPVVRTVAVLGYPRSVTLHGDTALVALGEHGVVAIPLAE